LLLVTAVAAAFLVVSWLVDERLRSGIDSVSRDQLRDAAQLVVHGVGRQAFSDSLADRLAAGTAIRVTLIGRDGTVLGDSDVPAQRLPSVENHADRPEVAAALSGREGVASRPSETVSRQLLYLALPHPLGVVRVSRSTGEQTSMIGRVRGILAIGAVATVLVVFGLGRLVTNMLARALGGIRQTAEAITSGDLSRRSRPVEPGELGALGRTIDDLADRIETVVSDFQREKADLDALFESLEDGLAVLDDEQIVVRANRAFKKIVGREDIEGERLTSLFRSTEVRSAGELATEGKHVDLETRLREQTFLVSGLPHGDGALLSLKDLTALRRLEGVRRDFVANVSHELKTPLTTVMGFAEPIADGEVGPDEANAFGRRILHNAKRMRRLVDDLLDLSRIEAGSWQPVPEELEVGAAVREVWASLTPAPESRRVRLVIEPEDALHAKADTGALMQILRNLLENAARYAPEGSEVEVRSETDRGGLRIEITDYGPGIPPVHQERIFERFYRVDPARSREEGGTGLGLSIVKHLVKAHGGEVGIVSDIGVGTTVWFTIPPGEASTGS
jgi:two-component system phosphate regulon sensor histidine kinase PhoR